MVAVLGPDPDESLELLNIFKIIIVKHCSWDFVVMVPGTPGILNRKV